jgi:hypothetical protein
MFNNLGKLFLTLCLLTVAGGVVANAHVDSDSRIQANIPFVFTVGDTTLPAGKYEIRTLDDASSDVLILRSADGDTSVIFVTENTRRRDNQPAAKTELVFNKVGDNYFLSQIWVTGNASGSELPKSRMERRLAGDSSLSEKHSVVGFLKSL